jgi:threonine/homoserine/homoserine lactone efflux protein
MYAALGMLAPGFVVCLTVAMAPSHTMMAPVNSYLRSDRTSGPKIVFGHTLIEMALFILIIEEVALATQRYAGIIAAVSGIALILFGALTLNYTEEGHSSRGGLQKDPGPLRMFPSSEASLPIRLSGSFA